MDSIECHQSHPPAVSNGFSLRWTHNTTICYITMFKKNCTNDCTLKRKVEIGSSVNHTEFQTDKFFEGRGGGQSAYMSADVCVYYCWPARCCVVYTQHNRNTEKNGQIHSSSSSSGVMNVYIYKCTSLQREIYDKQIMNQLSCPAVYIHTYTPADPLAM